MIELRENVRFQDLENLAKALEEKTEFHRNNPFDPHGISTAVIAALSEVVSAVRKLREES